MQKSLLNAAIFKRTIIACIFLINSIATIYSMREDWKMLLSTAIVADNHSSFAARKEQYITLAGILQGYEGKHPWVKNQYYVEAMCKKGPTFLEELSSNVYYAQSNNPDLSNKGLNEITTLLEGLDHFSFDSESMVVKWTGRYEMTSDDFLHCVEQNSNQYDCIVKICKEGEIKSDGFVKPGQVITAGFAMRTKYLLNLYRSANIQELDTKNMSGEAFFTQYLEEKSREGHLRIRYVDKLCLKANLSGSTTASNANTETIEL